MSNAKLGLSRPRQSSEIKKINSHYKLLTFNYFSILMHLNILIEIESTWIKIIRNFLKTG